MPIKKAAFCMAMPKSTFTASPDVAGQITVLRGQRVLLDSDLAALYGVSTARLNQQVRRNRRRFPADFLPETTAEELANLKLQFQAVSQSLNIS
jgi:hypothetical protein